MYLSFCDGNVVFLSLKCATGLAILNFVSTLLSSVCKYLAGKTCLQRDVKSLDKWWKMEEVTVMIWGMAHLCCEDRLGELGLFSLEKRKLRGDLKAGASAWRGCERAGEGLLTRACSDRTRSNGFKLKEGRFRWDIREKFFTLRVVRPWLRLPRAAVAAPSLAVSKARLNGALSNLVWWKGSLPMAGGLERDGL